MDKHTRFCTSVKILYFNKASEKRLTGVHVSSRVRGLYFGLSLHLHPNFVYTSSEVQASLRMYSDSPEPSLLDNVVSTKIMCIFWTKATPQ